MYDYKDIRTLFFLWLFNILPSGHFFNILRPVFLKCAGALLPLDGTVFIEKNVKIINPRALIIQGNLVMNDFCYLDCNGGVIISKGVRIAAGVKLLTTSHNGIRLEKSTIKGIEVGEYAHIGADSNILGGVTIGARAFIAPNSLIISSVKEGAIMSNQPARLVMLRKHL